MVANLHPPPQRGTEYEACGSECGACGNTFEACGAECEKSVAAWWPAPRKHPVAHCDQHLNKDPGSCVLRNSLDNLQTKTRNLN